MIIGKFQQEKDVFIGNVPAFAGPALTIRIAPTELKGIDYVVSLSGSETELGIGWKRKSGKGNEYVSLKLDSPFMPAPANCALVRQSDGGFALLWDRPKPKGDEDPAVDDQAAA